MMEKGLCQVVAGFIPLLDSMVLVMAREKGFARDEGIELTLVRETSWANIRDRLAVGHFHAAHMLAPMPIACNLGLAPLAAPLAVPMALGLGGNAVTVSVEVWKWMQQAGAPAGLDPAQAGIALRKVVKARGRPLRFAVVHPYSGHNYELRYWLAACGISPERDIEIVIVPPPLMADALGAGTIDGYCVGEPWNTAAALTGRGRIVTVKPAIWKSSPEKVLGVDAGWAEGNAEALDALLRALHRAALWCGDPSNHQEIAAVLARADYLNVPAHWLMPALSGRIRPGGGEEECFVDGFFIPEAKAANFPWKSHALWFYTQMVRWGQIAHAPERAAVARDTYRPDLYRRALTQLGVALPSANAKVEGALTGPTPVGSPAGNLVLGPDGFFDGRIFDPDELEAYIAASGTA